MRVSARATFLALTLSLAAASAARAQDDPVAFSGAKLPFDALRFTSGKNTLDVTADGRFTLTTKGRATSGTFSPAEWFTIAGDAAHADFAAEDGKTLGDAPSFTVEARSGGRTYSVKGAFGASDLHTFGPLVQALDRAVTDRTGPGVLASLFEPKLPTLEVEMNGKSIEVLDTGLLRIKENGKVTEATLTESESRSIARAVSTIRANDWIGDLPASDFSKGGERFTIIVYKGLSQSLVRGYVGQYGDRVAVGALVVGLEEAVARVEKPAPVAAPREEKSPSSESGLFSGLFDKIGRLFSDRGPSRTEGMSSLLRERVVEGTARERGDEARER